MANHNTDSLTAHLQDALLETIPCAVVVLDGEHRITHWNHSAEALTGYPATEMIGATCERLQAALAAEQDPTVIRAVCPAGRSGELQSEEYEIRARNGAVIPVLRRGQAITDSRGRTMGYIQALVDLRPTKAAAEQIRTLTRDLAHTGRVGPIVGRSPAMRKVCEAIDLVAATDASVVVEGETGTGKERVARTIHERSGRAEAMFLPVNCGALAESLLQAELFGHVAGAFTGAASDRAGRFEEADGGTLFLDEVGELTPASQVMLLRALQEGEITRVGESRPRPVDVRVIAATHRNLSAMIAAGTFREDLYYRLRVVSLRVPPLRERTEDIFDLVSHFIERLNLRYGRSVEGCSPRAMAAMEAHRWPGNVRELEHALEHAFVVTATETTVLPVDALPAEIVGDHAAEATGPASKPASGGDDEKVHVADALAEANGNKAQAARLLGITRAGLYKKLKRLGLS